MIEAITLGTPVQIVFHGMYHKEYTKGIVTQNADGLFRISDATQKLGFGSWKPFCLPITYPTYRLYNAFYKVTVL